MEIVLLERVEKLGQMGDVVNVKPGFARNFLLPQGKALRATRGNIARFEAEKAQLEAKNLERKAEAERVAGDLEGKTFVLIRAASDMGSLYGSVNTRHVAEAAEEAGFTIDRRQVQMDKPIKELGLHELRIHLHPEVIVDVSVNVARSPEEAEIQASGKTIQEQRAEDEAAAEFDIQELFEDGEAGEEASEGLLSDPRGAEEEEEPRS
jgi:large subunit ribosomal protein L9